MYKLFKLASNRQIIASFVILSCVWRALENRVSQFSVIVTPKDLMLSFLFAPFNICLTK